MTYRPISSNGLTRLCFALLQYEVWGSDQSNSIAAVQSAGVHGSFLWIWNSTEVNKQLRDFDNQAVPMTCVPWQANGPCNVLDMFPANLEQYDGNDSPTEETLGSLGLFGRLHGVIKDPMNMYVSANFFVLGGAYVGIIDTETKEAIALFRATKFNYGAGSSQRSIHMSYWAEDGSSIVIANLHGKAIERIDIERDENNKIVSASFNRAASFGLGQSMSVAEEATYFVGKNAFGNPLIGAITGSYDDADLGDLTPNNVCKENGCDGNQPAMGGRSNNLPICPITTTNGLVYATLAGGGLLILDSTVTPMTIVGEYGQNAVYGAGCGGVQSGNKVFLNAGVSASGAGADQSMFAVFAFDDTLYSSGISNAENSPLPEVVFDDSSNTQTGGNINPNSPLVDESGQLPGETTRRDSHGEEVTKDGKYLHVVDRIQNVVEVFDTDTYDRTTYDLTTKNGNGEGPPGACLARSVDDDAGLPLNDPAPDLFEITPDGKYFMIALRGPVPVSVGHAAQGSCPGVGIVEILGGTYL